MTTPHLADAQYLDQIVHESWIKPLLPVAPQIRAMEEHLTRETAAGALIVPPLPSVFRAFQAPLDDVRVVILGQDPYPTPGHAMGLSFSVARDVRPIPRSLVNIYAELEDDLGIDPAEHGDLTSWQDQGVLLLNRALTTLAGAPGAHSSTPWQEVTSRAIDAVIARRRVNGLRMPLVAILWGTKARELAPRFLDAGLPVIQSPHPSPLSARRGFFGSRPFSRTNRALLDQGAQPIDWRVR